MTKKKGCGIGCLALFSVAVILAGAATWYSREINHEYKAVQRSESALLAAVGEAAFIPPEDLILDPVRVDAFLSVRESLFENRQELEAAATEFAREKDRNQDGGLSPVDHLDLRDEELPFSEERTREFSNRLTELWSHFVR